MEQEKILAMIRERGPIVPSQISKELGTNILLASAILSELASRKLINISHVKVGGSPLYYTSGQEEKLQAFMDRLHEKEKAACDTLRDKKVLRDSALEPLTRVALRQCRDFAKPLEVTIDKDKEIFWKWYLLSNEEAEPSIRKELGIMEQKLQERRKPEQMMQATHAIQAAQAMQKEEQPYQFRQQELQKDERNPHSEKPEVIESGESQLLLLRKPKIKEKPSVMEAQSRQKPESEKIVPKVEPKIAVQKPETKPETKPEAERGKRDLRQPKPAGMVGFAESINEFFRNKNISVVNEQIIKKDFEMVYTVKVPNAVGEITYCCFAKKKQSCNESDLSYAYAQGHIKKLPILFITTGELTKKAKELLQASEFSNVTYIKI